MYFTCNEQAVYVWDVLSLPLSHTDDTRGVPKDWAFHDPAMLYTVGE